MKVTMEDSRTVSFTYKDITDSLNFLLESQIIQANAGVTDWHETTDCEDDTEKIRQEKIVAKDIMDHFQEREFASIAYFFKKAPPPSTDHLHLNLTAEQIDYEYNRQTRKIYLTADMIKGIEQAIVVLQMEKEEFMNNNFEDSKNNASEYFDLKIKNFKEIKQTYNELKGKQYQYTYLKLNNDRQFGEKLPIYSKKVEFLTKFKNSQVIILQSSAGSGKSTQLPQYMLETDMMRVAITEPRAIAVESVANRVSAELMSSLAPEGVVGYLCGPNIQIKAQSKIVYLTEHEFANQLIRDREDFLNSFDTFMIDEAHELRKPQVVILAVLKNHLKDHPHKRLIVTSATLESSLFLEYFKDMNTSLITAHTPTYGVQITYNLFPDLDTDITQNTLAHMKVILEVGLPLRSI